MNRIPDTAPLHEPPAFDTLTDAVRWHARTRPDALAFQCDGRRLSWRELDARMDKVAVALQASNIGQGDRVALLATTSLEAIEVLLGTARTGACIVPLAGSATPASLRTMLADAEASLLVIDQAAYAALAAGVPGVEASLPPLVGLDFPPLGGRAHEEWLAGAEGAPSPVAHDPQAPFNIIYSSGTTGAPKGIVHDHGMRLRQAVRRNYDMGPETVNLLATPLYSNTTLQPMFATLAHGGANVLMSKFDAGGYLELAQSLRATHTMLVPVQYQRILAHPAFAQTDLSSFLFKQCTGAPMSAALKRDIVARWPGRLAEIYGMTEGGTTCILDAAAHPDKIHTVGQPAPGHDIRIVDDAGKELPRGEAGEIVGRSAFMMREYFKQPAKTEEIYWYNEQGQAFHRTGDIARFDEDGFLVLLDRKKDMIISGGFNIYASDLEEVLAAHPDVHDAAVIGIPSQAWGETPLGLVVRVPGSPLTEAELLAWANAQVGKTQRLNAIEFRDSLPRSALGKLDKRALRAPYWAGSGEGQAAPR